MTEMVYGAVPASRGEPILPNWWRTVDKWSLLAVIALMGVGLLLAMAASPPLAEKNGFQPFHYAYRQLFFGCLGLIAMVVTTMMSPVLVRRLAVIGFAVALVAVLLLPIFGTDFGKGAVRWYSLGFGSVQPSEFLKPGFVVVAAWLIAASTEVAGPPGRSVSFALAVFICAALALQPDFGQASLILFAWGVMYFTAGAPMAILIHIASVWVPFTSESKAAIASYPEILKELKLGLQECGRKLGTHIRKGKRLKHEFEKRSYIEKYIPHIGIALQEILDLTDKQRDGTVSTLEDVLHRSRKF